MQTDQSPSREAVEQHLRRYSHATWMAAQCLNTSEETGNSQSAAQAVKQAEDWQAKANAEREAILALLTPAPQPTFLDELATYLTSTRIFLSSKERAHEAGLQWHDEIVAKVAELRKDCHV